MTERAPADYVVLGLDIIKYSKKNLRDQKLAQESIDKWFNEAIAQTRPSQNDPMPYWIDAGDGGYALFKWAEQEVVTALTEFYKRLNRENARFGDTDNDHKVLVRSAIHKEAVVVWDTKIADNDVKKFTGHAINNCARLMAGMIKEHDAQVVCSRPVLDSIMAMDANVSPTRVRDIEDKHGQLHEVWNIHVNPILGVNPIEKELYPDPLCRIYPSN